MPAFREGNEGDPFFAVISNRPFFVGVQKILWAKELENLSHL